MNPHPLPNQGPESPGLPSNLDAEGALIGAVLYDNTAYHLAGARIRPDSFAEPFHGRLWAAMAETIEKGLLAEPIGLLTRFEADGAFHELGGLGYLVDLVDRAPPAASAATFAATVEQVALRRWLGRMAGEVLEAVKDGAEDPHVLIEDIERSLLQAQTGRAKVSLTGAADAVSRVFDYLDAPADKVGGVRTGLTPMDVQLGPLMGGDLIVLGGRPSMGKSALASCIALNVASTKADHAPHGFGVIEINGEMSVDQMMRRHLTDRAFSLFGSKAPGYSAIRKRQIGMAERRMLDEAGRQIGELPLQMLKRPGLTLSSLRSLIRRQTAEWSRRDIPLGLVVVDHVGLLRTDQRTRSRYEEQTEISNGLKELADELQVPIIGLAQLNRETEKRDDKRPTLSDLRDTGAWEQDADVVIGVYRDAYYAQREPEPKKDLEWSDWDSRRKSRTVEAIALKVREGECGTIELWGDMRTNAIRGEQPDNDGGMI